MKREKEQKALQDMVAKDVEVEKKEEEFKEEATDKEQELRKAGNEKESDFFVETSVGEDESIEQPHVWTYVLVSIIFNQSYHRPSFFLSSWKTVLQFQLPRQWDPISQNIHLLIYFSEESPLETNFL